jgi:hypothetical protein
MRQSIKIILDFLMSYGLFIFAFYLPVYQLALNTMIPSRKGSKRSVRETYRKKRSLKKEEIKEKISTFYDFLNSISDPLPDELFGEILVNKSSKILLQEIKDKIQDLSELDKKILSFTLNFRARQQFFRI